MIIACNAVILDVILSAKSDLFLVVSLVIVVFVRFVILRLCVWRILEHSLECSSVHFTSISRAC